MVFTWQENQYRKTAISSNSMHSTSYLYLWGFFSLADFWQEKKLGESFFVKKT